MLGRLIASLARWWQLREAEDTLFLKRRRLVEARQALQRGKPAEDRLVEDPAVEARLEPFKTEVRRAASRLTHVRRLHTPRRQR